MLEALRAEGGPQPGDTRDDLPALVRHHAAFESRDPVLGSLCELALQLFDVELATITVGQHGEQRLLAQRGTLDGATTLRLALLDTAIAHDGLSMHADLAREPRYRNLPEVSSGEGIRFFAGMPLLLGRQQRAGVIGLFGRQPRVLDSQGLERLDLLSRLASTELDRRLAQLHANEQIHLLEAAAALSRVGSWMLDLRNGRVHWSRETHEILDIPLDVVPDARLIGSFWTESSRETGRRLLDALIERGEPFDECWQMRTASGRLRRMRVIGRAESADDTVIRAIGSVQDLGAWI